MKKSIALAASLLMACAALGQQATPSEIKPNYANVPYGPHERNVLDLWQARSDRPTPLVIFIHGGGFVKGDKRDVPPSLVRLCLDRGFSVAAISYRYSTQAPYPAPMEDGARAVQFLRWKAKEWNLDPKAFTATGTSAGAGMLMWLGFHNDMADPKSEDPVRRQSTRLEVLGPTNGQPTYDPRLIAKIVNPAAASMESLRTLQGLEPGQEPDERALRDFESASAITYLTADDPPVFMYYKRPMRPVPPAQPVEAIHDPRLGYYLKKRMDKLGIECQVHTLTEYKSPDEWMGPMLDFFQKHLKR